MKRGGYFFFYKQDIITEMKMKFILCHSDSEGEKNPLLNLLSDCGVVLSEFV